MRIAHVTATFPPQYTGTGMVCYHNALGLARTGHEVAVFTAECPLGVLEDPPELSVRRLPAIVRLGNAPLLPGLLGIKGFDIIHLHYPFIFGAEMIWAVSRLRNIPYVVTYHNDLIGDGLRRYLFSAYLALSARLVLRGARRLAVVSLDHAESSLVSDVLRERWGHAAVVPNGVDTELFHPRLVGTQVRERHGIPRGAMVILFVGALDRAHHYRRLDLLLEALGRLANPRPYLFVVGDGDRVAYYRSCADKWGLASQVRFLGTMDHRALATAYAASDILVLPSQLQESFGLVVIEAWACGKPVIASNLPGVRSVVSDGQDGLLVRPGDVDDLTDKMQALSDDPQRRHDMGQRGRRKVEEKYAWPKIIPRLVQVYEQALGAGGAGG